MRAGKLRHSLTIRSRSTANDGYGGKGTVSVTDVATVWASIEPVAAREFQSSQQRSSEREYTMRMRYDENVDLTAANELFFRDRTFEITGVLDIFERNRQWELTFVEKLTS